MFLWKMLRSDPLNNLHQQISGLCASAFYKTMIWNRKHVLAMQLVHTFTQACTSDCLDLQLPKADEWQAQWTVSLTSPKVILFFSKS